MTADATILPAGVPAQVEEDPNRRRRRRKVVILLLLFVLMALLIGVAIWYFLFRQPIPIPVIPPSAIPSYATSIYGASDPAGVAVTESGDRIYIAETEGDRVVRMFDAGGTELAVLAPPEETGTDHVPVYVAVSPATGEVFVSDRPAGAIYVYSADGAFQREFRPAVAIEGWQPLGLAFDANGNLVVTDLAAPQQVHKFDTAGRLVVSFGGDQALSFPNGVAVDEAGRIYVTDSNNGRLLVFEADGSLVGKIGRGSGAGNLGLPRGLAVDGEGRLFVVDSSSQGVLVYAALTGEQTTPEHRGFFGEHGVANGQFAFPMGIAVDGRGRVYIADTANDRIQVWSY